MTRRNALKMFGALFVCLAGRATVEASEIKDGSMVFQDDLWSKPLTYTFSEKGIKEIVIEKSDGGRVVVPFSDIIEALEK